MLLLRQQMPKLLVYHQRQGKSGTIRQLMLLKIDIDFETEFRADEERGRGLFAGGVASRCISPACPPAARHTH